MTANPLASTRILVDLLEGLSRFTGVTPGVTRLVYDPAWCEAHRWLAEQARDLGLAATRDSAGNLFFHDPALRPGDPSPEVVLTGSHLDTVKHGGALDGAYGAVAGLLTAAEQRGHQGLPVVGFVTCEEEGSRFPEGFLGVRSLLGMYRAEALDRVRDSAGVSWRAALEAARERGCAAPLASGDTPFRPLFRASAQIELHIEQGPVLEAAGRSLGIVEHIAGTIRLRLELRGEARHAGTTPMALRRDAFAAAAEIALAAESLARDMGDPAVATAGYVRPEPGLFNVIPGACELWLEARHTDSGALERLASQIRHSAGEIAARRQVTFAATEVLHQPPVALSRTLAERAEELAKERELSCRRMASGAGHDTMVFAEAGIPSLMIFVPSRGGISHSPEEYTAPEQLLTGCRFLSELVGRIARGD